MRDIKFRGKMINKYAEEWFYGDLIKVIDEKRIINYYIVTESYNSKNMNIELNTCQTPKVKKDTIGQYTGLKDKNGKEIYEGDIICWESAKKNYKVIFVDGGYCLDTPGFATDLYRCSDSKGNHLKVIGNIYDNKELLEE